MKEIASLNAYLHDFTSALFICGSILLWWLGKELRFLEPGSSAAAPMRRIVLRLKRITIAGLALSILFGIGRALMFERYEYGAELNRRILLVLIIKHLVFAGIVVWGLWVHATVRGRESSGR